MIPNVDMFGGVELLAGPPGQMAPLWEVLPDFPDFFGQSFDGDDAPDGDGSTVAGSSEDESEAGGEVEDPALDLNAMD